MTRANRASNFIALALAASLIFPTSAMACSLPYIDDVNEWGKSSSIATLAVYGKEKKFEWKVTDTKTHKSAKVKKYKRGSVATVVLKKGHTYKVSVRAKGGKWKSVKFGVC